MYIVSLIFFPNWDLDPAMAAAAPQRRPGFEHPPSVFQESTIAKYRVLTPAEIREFRRDFEACDEDKDGTIDRLEITHMLERNVGRAVSQEEVNQMMKLFDINGDGNISFEEYLTAICGQGWVEDDPPNFSTRRTVMVVVDRSEVAEKAFINALRMLVKRSPGKPALNDRLIIYHVTCADELKGKPSMYQAGVIMNMFEEDVFRIKLTEHFEVQYVTEEKKHGSLKAWELIRNYADAHAGVEVPDPSFFASIY